jgi:alginate O-acetyltransferase complex protein AlgI
MLFTSPSFLFFFLPVFCLIFRLVSRQSRLTFGARLVIIIGTYVFYSFENVGYLLPFVFATFMDLLWSILLKRNENPRARRWIVTASVVQNLLILTVYKYTNWLVTVFPGASFLHQMQIAFADESGLVTLPPGVSFYLFESMSFVIDCYRHKIETPRRPINFLTFIGMFPRFIAGPIVRYADLENSIHNYKGSRWGDGFFVFAVGFVLKILFADSFARIIEHFFGNSFTFLGAWGIALSYTFQLYLDFSVYSLMAIGLGLILGFPFLDNFREPYLALNVTEFWRKWHISLSTWLRDYLYIPLGGNRVGRARGYVNLMLTMILGGLWHGANVTFLLWGAYHGVLLTIEKMLRNRGIEVKSRALTFILIVFGWVYFRAQRASEGERMVNAMFGLNGLGWIDLAAALRFNFVFTALAALGLIWIFWLEPQIRRWRGNAAWAALNVSRVPWFVIASVGFLFVVAVLLSISNPNIPFLYFQF